MTTKKNYYWGFLFLLLSAFVLDNCRPKNNDDVEPIDSTAISSCILLNEKVNGILLRTYEFDSTRTLTRMLEYRGSGLQDKLVKRYTFEYNSRKKVTRIRETNIAEQDRSFIYEMDYANSTQLKAIRTLRIFNSGARPQDTLAVVYGIKTQITELKSLRGLSSKWEYDSAGNVKKWSVRRPLATSDSLLAEYGSFDDKVNIYTFSEGMQLLNLLSGQAPSKRNPLTYTFQGQSVEATYQYNEKRVPTQSVLKFKNSDNSIRETVYTYELNCK